VGYLGLSNTGVLAVPVYFNQLVTSAVQRVHTTWVRFDVVHQHLVLSQLSLDDLIIAGNRHARYHHLISKEMAVDFNVSDKVMVNW
ncbi:hypothetical protein MTO96_049992, partial [Rhipicephalus appendiculatus]